MSDIAVEPATAVAEWLGNFEEALAAGDAAAAAALFGDDGLWRDIVAFTWNIKTLEGPEEIRAMLETQREVVPRDDGGELDTALAFLNFARSCLRLSSFFRTESFFLSARERLAT